MVNEKRQARRTWQQSRDPADKTMLNNKTQRLNKEIRKIKEESISSCLQNLTIRIQTIYSGKRLRGLKDL